MKKALIFVCFVLSFPLNAAVMGDGVSRTSPPAKKGMKKEKTSPASSKQGPASKVDADSGDAPRCPSPRSVRDVLLGNITDLIAYAPKPIQEKLQDPKMYEAAFVFILKKAVHYTCLYWGGHTPEDMLLFWDMVKMSELISKNSL